MTDETSPSPKEAFPLAIPRPCPMLVSRMTPEGDNFHCRTCQHVTYDLREKSQEEVHEFFKRHQEQGLKPCVIVHDEQLHKVPEYRGIKRWVMAALTAASWLGLPYSHCPLRRTLPRHLRRRKSTPHPKQRFGLQKINPDSSNCLLTIKRQRKSGAFGLFGDRTPKVRVRSLVALYGIEDLA